MSEAQKHAQTQLQNNEQIKHPSNIQDLLKEASQLFSQGQYQKCMQMYNNLLQDVQNPKYYEILLNRASLNLTIKNYGESVADCKRYLQENKKQVDPQIYVVYLSGLIKVEDIEAGMQVFKQANEMFPYHKKIGELGKLCKQKSMTNDEEIYVEHMFQKLIMHPKIREYCKEEAFLTKVERMIRNPSLTSALQKLDPRVKEAADVMMMADENWH